MYLGASLACAGDVAAPQASSPASDSLVVTPPPRPTSFASPTSEASLTPEAVSVPCMQLACVRGEHVISLTFIR